MCGDGRCVYPANDMGFPVFPPAFRPEPEAHKPVESDVWLEDTLWGNKGLFDQISKMMLSRHKKYGVGNIAKHGLGGILVRLDDKIERLSNSRLDFTDEKHRDAWLDVVGYGLIGLMWVDGDWPGSPKVE